MTLEQRVEALEMAVASMAAQQSNTEEIAEIARKVTTEVIANAQRPGGVLNAAQNQTADHFIQEVNDKIVSSELFSQLS
ncbi:hypothetical protein [Salmonella enterica]|uniref:hypothetical protein n=1 Tax=unclassified Salmonella TaxID=2614656 RepID=UPI0034E4D40C|nr:hypothetical protein [Salmonella enterica]EFV3667242.1 hypothetical protein [Salmonella enterica]MDJ4401731.1 hypothetical protein [Salmonella enterica]MDJ6375891.1 hypothetical protein [Salmonella enterica]MDJ7783289.1 hypothetical protein [Salmonella enterica]